MTHTREEVSQAPRRRRKQGIGEAPAFADGSDDQERIRLLELLVQEVDHRAKNNLQLAASLLLMQARACPRPDAKAELAQASRRLFGLGAVHQALFLGRTTDRVDLGDLLRLGCAALSD